MNIYFTDIRMQQCAENLDIARKIKQHNILSVIISNVLRINPVLAGFASELFPMVVRPNTVSFRLEQALYDDISTNHPTVVWANANAFNFSMVCLYQAECAIDLERSCCPLLRQRKLNALVLAIHNRLEDFSGIRMSDVITDELLYRSTKEQYKHIEATTKAYQKQLTDLWKGDILAAVEYKRLLAEYQAKPVGMKPRIKRLPCWIKGYTDLSGCPEFAYNELKPFLKEATNA